LVVAHVVIASNATDLLLFSPLRPLIWFMLPYPLIFPDFEKLAMLPRLLHFDPLTYAGTLSDLAAIGSTWMILLALPMLISAVVDRSVRKSPGWRFLAVCTLVPLIIIPNLMPIMGRRYRVLIEPLLLAWAIWGWIAGKPSKFAAVVPLALFLAGFVYLYEFV
jgi:hypothetical protein